MSREPTKLGELIARVLLACDAHGCMRVPNVTIAYCGHEFELCEPCAEDVLALHKRIRRGHLPWRVGRR